MVQGRLNVVTGAFSYTGRNIARLLLDRGERVRTLTGHPDRPNPFRGAVEAFPYNFDDRAAMIASLRGAEVLYNTYWVRFPRAGVGFEQAVENSRTLIGAAAEAGVRRFVHISIANPSEDSPLPYYRGKAAVERALAESGLSYAIVRPTVLFGAEDILINNIAWMLRRLPVFGIFGRGDYGIQPVHVADVAALAVELGDGEEDAVRDAAGPERYSFEDLVALIRQAVGGRARLIRVPPALGLVATRALGRLLHDVVLTRDEIRGLMAGLLVSHEGTREAGRAAHRPPPCATRCSEWLTSHAAELGITYRSELARHYR
jgi:NADH dehydrogenase